MTRIRLRRLTTDRSQNITRYYVRLPGQPKIRIHGEPGSEAFMAAYRAAIAGIAPAQARLPSVMQFAAKTLGRAILDYYGSAAYAQLGDSRKRSRRAILDKLASSAGAELIKNITKGTIQKGLDRRAAKPSAANEFLKAVRAVFAHLVRVDEVSDDPSAKVSYIPISTDGFHVWTLKEVTRFIEHHKVGSSAVLAMALLLFTGQRRGDVIRMGPQHVKDGWIKLRQRKSRRAGKISKEMSVPVLPALQAIIDQSRVGQLNFIVTAFGKPFSDAGFGNRFRVWCDVAGLKHCSAHGLRKAGATIAAELGATDEQLMALFGWESRKQVATYTRGADQKRLANEAAHRIASALTMNKIVPSASEVESDRDNQNEKLWVIK